MKTAKQHKKLIYIRRRKHIDKIVSLTAWKNDVQPQVDKKCINLHWLPSNLTEIKVSWTIPINLSDCITYAVQVVVVCCYHSYLCIALAGVT